MTKEQDLVLEVEILRDKLTAAEDRLNLVDGALMESSMRMRTAMRRLLKANDVNFDPAMRINILEIMNDMSRDVIDFFHGKNLSKLGSKDLWDSKVARHASDDYGRRL